MYIDDVLARGHTIDAAIKVRDKAMTVFQSAGFSSRKYTWSSNKILEGINKSDLLSEDFLEFEDTSSVAALGIRWNAHFDQFYFTAKPIKYHECPTKHLARGHTLG